MNDDRPVVLVTGAGGWIGGAAMRALDADYRVVGLDRRECDAKIAFDLTSDMSVGQALDQVRDAYGGTLAAVINVPNPHAGTHVALEVAGMRRLLDRLQRFRVGRFVHLGSLATNAHPQNVERTFAERHGAIPYLIVHAAPLYADDRIDPALAAEIAQIRDKTWTSHLRVGAADRPVSLLHIDDLVRALRMVVDRRATLPDALTLPLGEHAPPTLADILDRIGQTLHGTDWPTVRVPGTIATAERWVERKIVPRLSGWLGGGETPEAAATDRLNDIVADLVQARDLLGWRPRRRLQATMPTIVRALSTRRTAESGDDRDMPPD